MADQEAEEEFLRSMQDTDDVPQTEPSADEPSDPAPQSPAKQPRTVSGFIVDDDDGSEDDNEEAQEAEEYNPESEAPVASANELNASRDSSSAPHRAEPESAPIFSHNDLDSSEPNAPVESEPTIDGSVAEPTTAADAVDPSEGVAEALETAKSPAPSAMPMNEPAASVQDHTSTMASSQRLSSDRVGILEDRIKDDPRGDLDAWLGLINEYKRRNKVENIRETYNRFLAVFPTSADQWVAFVDWELENQNLGQVEKIFSRSLLKVHNLDLWVRYLNYVRRRHNLATDTSGTARDTVFKTYEFVVSNIGLDKDAGDIWKEYLDFIRTGPGQLGGNGWQDQQKMDNLRKTYHRALCIPLHNLSTLWKEYNEFELQLSKMNGRKFVQERSPAFVTARTASVGLQTLTRDLQRTTMPRLPPALGFDGDVEYMQQVDIWKAWVAWEKDDPLVLKDEDRDAFKARILLVYRQAVMALRFWPDIWFEAAEFCLTHDMEAQGVEFLQDGSAANPESCLLAFKRADQVESTTVSEAGDDAIRQRGAAVREPYDKVLDALYGLIAKAKERETRGIASVREQFANTGATGLPPAEDNDDYGNGSARAAEAAMNAQIDAVKRGNGAQIQLLSRTVSFVWIALMRAMRRVQGQGRPGDSIGGSRQIFTDARKRGRLTSEVYVASALMEYHCYQDPVATKIFERGMKLFPEDENFALEYIKHLIAINDITNARSVFETTVTKLSSKPETLVKSKPIYAFFYHYESQYGELSQIQKLEKRIQDLFPNEGHLSAFSQRFAEPGFDPAAIRPVVSLTQTRPRSAAPPSIDALIQQESPRAPMLQPLQATNSPKRPLEDSDSETLQPRKIPRSESPLKGAAGRRLDAAKRTQMINANGAVAVAAPGALPLEIVNLMSTLPRPGLWQSTQFLPERVVDLLRSVDLSRANLQPKTAPPPTGLQPSVPPGYAPQPWAGYSGPPPGQAPYAFPR